MPEDVTAFPLLEVRLQPVVAAQHPLAVLGRPATGADLEQSIQLVLSDPVDPGGPSYGVTGAAPWRFVDLARRLDFLLAGFGWCKMPEFLIADHVAAGRLVSLDLADDLSTTSSILNIYAAHMSHRMLGPAGR